MTALFCRMPAGPSPLPGPATASAGAPSSAQASAAADEEIRPGGQRPARRGASRFQCRLELLFRHCRRRCEIRSARPAAVCNDALRTLAVAKRADIDDLERGTGLRREHIDGRTARAEVADHLPCHTLRVGGNTVNGYAVVGGEYRHAHVVDARLLDALQPSKLHGHVLEPTEGSARLRQL